MVLPTIVLWGFANALIQSTLSANWTPPRVLEAFADFVDLRSPHTAGHSLEVAALAADAYQAMTSRDLIA